MVDGERRLEHRSAQHVDTGDMERVLGIGDADIELEHRAYGVYAADARNGRVKGFRETAAPAAHFDIGFSGDGAYGSRYVRHRRAVDEVHGVSQRNAERDAQDRQEQAGASAMRIEDEREAQHRWSL